MNHSQRLLFTANHNSQSFKQPGQAAPWLNDPAALPGTKPFLNRTPIIPQPEHLTAGSSLAQPLEEYQQIEQWYGQPVTPELYQFDDRGRQRKRLAFLESILPPLLTPDFKLRLQPTLQNATPTIRLLWDLHFYPFLALALAGGEWHEYSPLLHAFTDTALAHIPAIAQQVGIGLESKMTACSIAGRFLDHCGLKTTSVQCRRIVTPTGALLQHTSGQKQDPSQPQTQRVRIYRLHPELLHQVWTILQHRHNRRKATQPGRPNTSDSP